jgi:hypothetical protein
VRATAVAAVLASAAASGRIHAIIVIGAVPRAKIEALVARALPAADATAAER